MLWYTPFVRCAVAHGAPFASVSRCAVVHDNDCSCSCECRRRWPGMFIYIIMGVE